MHDFNKAFAVEMDKFYDFQKDVARPLHKFSKGFFKCVFYSICLVCVWLRLLRVYNMYDFSVASL